MNQIGKPVLRLEDGRFLQGGGAYVDDIHLDRMLHAVVFSSSWPHARVHRIHTRKPPRRCGEWPVSMAI
jgi:carbon-monoxide dehydrogenase large subunit